MESQNVLFTVCALNELFFIALYLLSFSSPRLMPSLIQSGDELSSLQPGSPSAPSIAWGSPWSAGAMELAR
jgi:CDP-diacylglycerol--inositol 3-phosphatidyltransferase